MNAPESDRLVDRRIGERIRRRRTELGLTQEQLGARIALSYQQIQKYERGANAITARKLVDLGRALDVSPAYFFEEVADPSKPPLHGGTLRPDIDIARGFRRIADGPVRSSLAGLVRALASRAARDDERDP
ncbi:MAG: helix-turn-helix domain-containing protein [Pseudomonadota bacterium]